MCRGTPQRIRAIRRLVSALSVQARFTTIFFRNTLLALSFDEGFFNFHTEVSAGGFDMDEDFVAGFEGRDGKGFAVGGDQANGLGVLEDQADGGVLGDGFDEHHRAFFDFVSAEIGDFGLAVGIDEPKNGYYGGQVAAPVMREIAIQAAAILGIKPATPPTNLRNAVLTAANR